MIAPNTADAAAKNKKPPRRPRRQPVVKKPLSAASLGQGASPQASQRAAVILEVLAGERTPQQAAAVLSMSVPNFYIVERKALQGLLLACEPQPKGPPAPGPERKLQALELELARCRRECQRQEALVRATQRAVGLPSTPTAPARAGKGKDPQGRRRRQRRPVVRALRAARTLRQNSTGSPAGAALQQPQFAPQENGASTHERKEAEHVTSG